MEEQVNHRKRLDHVISKGKTYVVVGVEFLAILPSFTFPFFPLYPYPVTSAFFLLHLHSSSLTICKSTCHMCKMSMMNECLASDLALRLSMSRLTSTSSDFITLFVLPSISPFPCAVLPSPTGAHQPNDTLHPCSSVNDHCIYMPYKDERSFFTFAFTLFHPQRKKEGERSSRNKVNWQRMCVLFHDLFVTLAADFAQADQFTLCLSLFLFPRCPVGERANSFRKSHKPY